jgi:hypothetical protein
MSEQPLTVLGYMDVVLIVIAAPIMLLIGVPAAGYCIAGGTWIALRAVGVAVDRFAAATPDASRQIGIRMGYMLGRLFTLAIVIILVRRSDGQDAGLTALAVIVFAFTAQMVLSAFTRPRPSSKSRPSAAPRTRSR